MKITINGTDINVLKCIEEFDYDYRGLYFVIDQNEIDLPTLRAVVTTNEGDIVRDDNGVITIFSGFTQSSSITADSDGMYYIKLGSVPKTEKKVAELNTQIDTQSAKLKEQADTIDMLTSCLLEMSETIYA